MPMDKGHGARQAVVVVNHKSQICSGFKSSSRRSHKISWDEPNIAHEILWSAGNPAAGLKKKNVAKSPVPTYSRYWLMVLKWRTYLVPSRETLICLHGTSGVQFHRAERAQNIPDSRWASAWHTKTRKNCDGSSHSSILDESRNNSQIVSLSIEMALSRKDKNVRV